MQIRCRICIVVPLEEHTVCLCVMVEKKKCMHLASFFRPVQTPHPKPQTPPGLSETNSVTQKLINYQEVVKRCSQAPEA